MINFVSINFKVQDLKFNIQKSTQNPISAFMNNELYFSTKLYFVDLLIELCMVFLVKLQYYIKSPIKRFEKN
jgi:hypothetical protein